MPRTALDARRSRRTSCSILALATVMAVGATPAAAQSFLGSGSFTTNGAGSANINNSVANLTTVTLNGGQTIIDWTPTDNAMGGGGITFQNSGTTALFTSSSDFAVLNRINQADINRAIIMNGTVNARVSGVQRGSVYFYSPGGFIFGGSSVFSVGSLVVTASPIQLTGNNFINGAENTVVFGQAPNPNAFITSGGTISANSFGFGVLPPGNSYVAMVAPRVAHSGTINVNGSAALVGAEAASINFSPDGLFDIQVTVGSDDDNGVQVTGDITGPEPGSATDRQSIYLVAVPKNDAITLLVGNGADLGFTLANDAAIDDAGVVVLSAGHDISNGAIGAKSAAPGTGPADLWFTGAHATNNVIAEATRSAYLYSVAPTQPLTTFDSNLSVHAADQVWLNAGVGTTLTVAGDVSLSTDRSTSVEGGAATGGNTYLYALDGATLTIGGDLSMSADGYGGSSGTSGLPGGTGTGGHVLIQAGGGSLTVSGDTYVSASGFGGSGFGTNGGEGVGGFVQVESFSTPAVGTLSLGGALSAYAQGTGGSSSWGFTSGNGTGGHLQVRAQANSSVDITNGIYGDATGRGGFTDFQVNGGSGEGGLIELLAQGGSASLNAGDNVTLVANGEGGSGGECIVCGGLGGDGLGGDIFVGANSGANNLLTLPGTLTLTANGYGGVGVDTDGGTGTGGHVQLYAADGSTVSLTGNLTARADGYGGERVNGGYGGDNPTIAGDGIGGLAELLTYGTGDPQLLLAGSASLHADGFGGNVVEIAGGSGGNGTGGVAGVFANAGDIDVDGSLIASALGEGGSATGGWGGDGTGRNAEIFASLGGNVTLGGPVILDVSGSGGDGNVGGDGVGGGIIDDMGGTDGAHIFAKNGSITVTGVTTLDASGYGGNGANGGAGGNAQGGWTTIHARNTDVGQSNITLSTTFISANATGGAGGDGASGSQGGDGGAGGNATAGDVGITANAGNGHVAVTFANGSAVATGGAGGDGGNGDNLGGGNGGAGGNAEGGSVTFGTSSGGNGEALASNLGTATFTTASMDTSATGGDGGSGNFGTPDGNGGAGGVGDGGSSLLLVRGSAVTVTGTTTLTANGSGGNGGFGGGDFGAQGAGGDGFAGEVAVISSSRFMIPTQLGTLNAGAIIGTASGSGGFGSTNGSGIVEGGSTFQIDRSTVNIGSLDFDISGDFVDEGADPSRIAITNATVDVDTTFDFSTIGELSFYIDNGSLTAGTLALTAGNFITDQNLPAPTLRGTAFASSLFVTSGGDFIADANFNVTNGIDITVPGSIRFGDATTVSFIDLDAQGGSIDLDNVTADGDIILNANGLIDIGTAQAGFFRADAGTTFTSGNITSDADIRIGAGGDVTLGDLSAGLPAGESSKAVRIDTDGSVLVGDMVALGGIDVTAQGSVTGENVTTGDVLITEANGAISYGTISAGLVNPQPSTELVSVGLDSATSINVGDIDAAGMIALITGGTLTAGDLTTETDILAFVHGNMTIGDIDAGGRVLLADSSMFTNAGGTIGDAGDDDINPDDIFTATPVPTNGSITVGDVLAGSFTAAAGTSLTTGLIDTDSGITLGANGAISTGDLVAGDFVLGNGGSITTGDIDASSVAMTSESGNIATGDIFAFGDVELDAFGDIGTGDIYAGSIDLFAGDDIATGHLTTQQFVLLDQGGGGITTQLYPGASITLEAGDDIATGNIFSIDGVYANAGGSIATGWIFANDFVELFAVDDISSGYIDAGQYIYTDSGDDQALGNLAAGWDIDLNAGGDIAFGDGDAGTEFDFEAGGNVAGGDIVAGIEIGGEGAGGNIVLGDLTAGFGEGVPEDVFSVGFYAGGSITVGNVNGALSVGFGSQGNLTTGNIQAGDDFLALAGGNILVNGTVTTGAGDRVYMANFSMCATGGGCTPDSETDFDPEIVFALDPVPTGGSITINGLVTTGEFDAAAGTGLTTQAITASGDIHASAGGTATLNGLWSSGDDVELASSDIDITASGGISAADGVGLFSTNATQALIGDGLTGTGYALSNAEFGRISGYDVAIAGRGDASAAIDMLIGDLTVTGPLAGSTIEGAEGILAFGVGDIDGETVSGVIRVNGDIAATGFGGDNAIEFYATRFELDAATGSVSILSSGSTLGGEIGLYADRIHVAEATILNQLAANPTYTGYQEDLNEAATVQRPEGVLRADTLWIESDNLQDILIQNTGTTDAPAGFLVREAFVNDDEEVAGPPGSINMVVNGQVVTESGTLTGIEARDALIDEETDITPFTSNSTINGCPLSGPCVIAPPPPPPSADVVDNQIDLITGGGLGDGEFGNEDSIDDNEEGDEGANNPISPPQPLFDTRPLIPSSDVNDPVSGTGNPALLGTSECVDDDENQCGTEKETGQ